MVVRHIFAVAVVALVTATCVSVCAARADDVVDRASIYAAAERAAASYDYGRAVDMLRAFDDAEAAEAIARFEAASADCVAVDPAQVTHIFYHSLVVDPVRAFSSPDKRPAAVGHNQWMTTIDEFNKITQEMYDRGYVLIGIHDLVEVSVDAKGRERLVRKPLMLPRGKKAAILSLDDISYYHAYNGYGYASKIVLEDGRPMCQYTDANGVTTVGAYDAIPLLDAFIEEHPDASYRGAKGIIALTGYNGILGYRTDATYDRRNVDDPKLSRDKRRWLKAHPEFDREAERAKAKEVCDALRADGWEFASHSWGHQRYGQITLAHLKTDAQKWADNVAPLVGGTDILIYAHGNDIGNRSAYDMKNERYKFLRSMGFRMFFNVSSISHTLRIYDDFVLGGRRNLDGYRLYSNVHGGKKNLADLFDAKRVLDPARPPVVTPR